MVRSNASIPGKILLILLTVVFTIAALAGTIVVVYKTVKVRDLGNLLSEDLIDQNYDGTIEDVVQTIAGKFGDGTLTLQDLIDISPALGSALDALVGNLENVGLFRVDKAALYSTPVTGITGSLRSVLIITGTLNDLASTAGFALPDLPVITGGQAGQATMYTRANEDGSGKIDDEFAFSSTGYAYHTRTPFYTANYTERVEAGQTEEGDPVYTEEEHPIVQWTQKKLYSLQGLEKRGTDLYYGGHLLYLRTKYTETDEDGVTAERYTYTRLTTGNDAVYSLLEQGAEGAPEEGGDPAGGDPAGGDPAAGKAADGADGGNADNEGAGEGEDAPEAAPALYDATFALRKGEGREEDIVFLGGLNDTDEDYEAVALAPVTAEDEQAVTVSLPEVAAKYRYTPLFAQLDTAPAEGSAYTEWNGKYYVPVNTYDAETGRYALDADNGGFLIADAYRDGQPLYALEYETGEELTLDEAQALAAKNVPVYVKTEGLASLPLVYAINALSDALDTDTLTLEKMDGYFGLNFADNALMQELLYVPFAYLSDSMQATLNNIALEDVLDLNADSSKTMLYLAYGEEGVGYEIAETVDEETGEVTGRELIVHERKTVGSVTTATETMQIGDLLEGESSSPLLAAVRDWTINDLSNDAKIDSLTLGQVLTVNESSPNILQQLADVCLGDISSAVDTLTVEEILGSDAIDGDPVLELLRTSSLETMADDVKALTLQELFADEVYEYHTVGAIVPAGESSAAPNRADYAALQALYGQNVNVYGAENLYVRENNTYRTYDAFKAAYDAAYGNTPEGEDYAGAVPQALFSPYYKLTEDDIASGRYDGAPLYYLAAETATGEDGTQTTTHAMRLATEVTGWKLPETLPEGVTAGTAFGVRVAVTDGEGNVTGYEYVTVTTDGNSDYYDAGRGMYLVSALYYRDAASQAVKALSLTPADYGLKSDLPDGAALFARRVYAGTYSADADTAYEQTYEQTGLYWYDPVAGRYRLLPLAAVYADAENPSKDALYYYGADGNLYAVNGAFDPETGLPVPVEGMTVVPAYFDESGKLYIYRENEGEGGASQLWDAATQTFVSGVEAAPRYAADRTQAAPEEGTKLYSYGQVTGLWKYLLLDENGVEAQCSLQNAGSLITNMRTNINRATLAELVNDGMLTIRPPEGMTVEGVLTYEINIPGSAYEGRTLGSLTINEMLSLMLSVLVQP